MNGAGDPGLFAAECNGVREGTGIGTAADGKGFFALAGALRIYVKELAHKLAVGRNIVTILNFFMGNDGSIVLERGHKRIAHLTHIEADGAAEVNGNLEALIIP